MKKYLFMALLMLSTTFYASNNTEPSRLDDALATVVEKGLVLAEKTGTFVINKAPELIQEFYQWHVYENIFGICFGILILFIGYKIPFLWTQKDEDYNNNHKYFNRYCDDPFFPYVIFWISFIIGAIFMITSIYDLIFLITAPKLYLIEYFIK